MEEEVDTENNNNETHTGMKFCSVHDFASSDEPILYTPKYPKMRLAKIIARPESGFRCFALVLPLPSILPRVTPAPPHAAKLKVPVPGVRDTVVTEYMRVKK